MARVEWTRLSGDEVESVLAILICREYVTAIRIKPSVGDGGIDLRVTQDTGISVFQIKSYTGKTTATRKKHIAKSLKAAKDYAAAIKMEIAEWVLIMPENPSKEALKWFDDELTAGFAAKCSWRGLDYVDGLAAKYPDVIDYYLRDGKDRLQAVVKDFLAVAGATNTDVEPSSSIESIERIHSRLNRFDPHYRYDFSVDALGVDGKRPPVSVVPGLVGAVQVCSENTCITYKIIARFNEAVNERPIPGSMTFAAEPGSELEKQILDWVEFGVPLTDVPVQNVIWGLPGGFGGDLGDAVVTIGNAPPAPGSGTQVSVRILDGDGTIVCSLDFLTEEVSTGLRQQGLRAVAHDMTSGLVRLEMRMKIGSPPRGTINLAVEDYAGRSPADMLRCFQFLSEVKPPRRMQLFLRNGPALAPPWDIPQNLLADGQGGLWCRLCADLATIQESVIERIGFPDLSGYSQEELADSVESWNRAARILRGEPMSGTWSEVEMCLAAGQGELPPGPLQGAFVADYSVRIANSVYPVGSVTMHVATLRQDETRPPVAHDDHVDVWVVPNGDDASTIRYNGCSEGGRPAALMAPR